MAVQYAKLTHTTLPSVEGWGSNANILRDPPKSITTRRIDKVGQNVDITELVDDSGDRINEGIMVFARGVNPMVSVSYDNNSNNAGISGNPTSTSSQTQARLPYPAFDNGAFRPPIMTQRDLLPLSRLPRTWFQTLSTPGFVDFSKTQQQPNSYRALREANSVLHFDIKPNRTANIEKPIIENFKMLNSINDKHINIDANAGIKTDFQSTYTRENIDLYKGINENSMNVFANSNLVKEISHNLEGFTIDQNRYIQDSLSHEGYTNLSRNNAQNLSNITMDTSKYVQDVDHYQASSNKSMDISNKSLDQLYDNGRMSVKEDVIQYSTNSGIKPNHTFLNEIAAPVLEMRNPQFQVNSQVSDSRVHRRVEHLNELQFERNTPLTNFKTNVTKLEDFDSMNLSSRNFRLDPTLQKGGFNNAGVQPTTERVDLVYHRENDKDRLRNAVNSQQFHRDSY